MPSNKIEWFPCSVKIFLALFGPLVRLDPDSLGLWVDVVAVGVVGENGIEEGPASAIWGSSYSSAAFVSIGLMAMVTQSIVLYQPVKPIEADPPKSY